MAESIEDLLDEYVQSTLDMPWRWGVLDCTMWVADWYRLRWGMDPAAGYRGTYHTQQQAADLVQGGMVGLFEQELWIPRKDVPEEGDVGVVQLPISAQVAAIRFTGKWAFRTENGLSMTSREAIAIWGD